ncbi:MAG: addiction module protein [Syntrophales bacterium]
MGVALSVEKMSIEEKIQAMEAIWDDLSEKAESRLSAPWHKEVLNYREKGIISGEDVFIDWNNAKKKIEKSIS